MLTFAKRPKKVLEIVENVLRRHKPLYLVVSHTNKLSMSYILRENVRLIDVEYRKAKREVVGAERSWLESS